MQFDFFPSRRLTIYLAKTFVVRIVAVLLMLVLVLQALDMLSESGNILAVPGNGQTQLWEYLSLRVPQLVARFLPYSVLLATIITLATLNQNSEVIAMKAAGLSAHQVLAPLILAATVVAGISFAFNERIVTRATASLTAWKSNDYRPVPPDSGIRSNMYLSDGADILAAATVTGNGAATRMTGVTWYGRDPKNMIYIQIRGAAATFANPGWTIADATRFDVRSAETSTAGSVTVAKGITPAQVAISSVDADALPLTELSRSIEAMQAAGRRTSELQGQWWHKLSGPLSAILMPLLGAVAAFGLARSGQLFLRAVIGMALGFAYFVVDNAALAVGNFGGYPPFLAAWAPFLLFLLIGETVLVRTEE